MAIISFCESHGDYYDISSIITQYNCWVRLFAVTSYDIKCALSPEYTIYDQIDTNMQKN